MSRREFQAPGGSWYIKRWLISTACCIVVALEIWHPSFAIAQTDVSGQSEAAASAAGVPAPLNVTAADVPWDGGERVKVTWTPPADASNVTGYKVAWRYSPGAVETLRAEWSKRAEFLDQKVAENPSSESWKKAQSDNLQRLEELKINEPVSAGTALADAHSFVVENLEPGVEYIFSVRSLGADGAESAAVDSAAVAPVMQFFAGDRFWVAIIELIICSSVVVFIGLARKGYPLKIRKIAGLDAVSEAVGRATEMGRPVLFVPGIQDMNDIQTIAGITVLGSVARTAAEYDARIEVPTSRSLVMTAARETTQSAYLAAGRPDAYSSDKIYYVTDEQFGYVAYLTGHMAREKPAACFYMGAFYAESLILAETGNSIGAIQIAGTAEPSQLPFFVAACDYTLIGEEFFAASAYLSGEPDQLGSLKGQDVGKMIVGAGLVLGSLLATIAELDPQGTVFDHALKFIKDTMLA